MTQTLKETVKVPKGCKITVKSKIVEVTGKHGSLKRDFKHLPIELFLANGGKKVVARMYFAKSKQCSMLNTVCSHISNLFEGVTKKFEYKMRLVYAHFPININIINGGKTIEIRNFLGEKVVRTVHMLPGALVEKSASTKDEANQVSQCAEKARQVLELCASPPPLVLPVPPFPGKALKAVEEETGQTGQTGTLSPASMQPGLRRTTGLVSVRGPRRARNPEQQALLSDVGEPEPLEEREVLMKELETETTASSGDDDFKKLQLQAWHFLMFILQLN
eukprot:g11556.t2